MKRPAFKLMTEPLPPKCGCTRGPRSKTHCELPVNHDGIPLIMVDNHIGRSPTGRWFSWPVESSQKSC